MTAAHVEQAGRAALLLLCGLATGCAATAPKTADLPLPTPVHHEDKPSAAASHSAPTAARQAARTMGSQRPQAPAAAEHVPARPAATAYGRPMVPPSHTKPAAGGHDMAAGNSGPALIEPRDDPYFELERCPPEMALLPRGVCIDRWEASLVELLAGGAQQPWSPYISPPSNRRFMAVSRPQVVPQGYINGKHAEAACKAAGKRLCRVAEWELACRGPEDTPFPYGRRRRAGVCNDDGRAGHPVAEAGRRLGWSLDRMWRQGMGHEIINQLPNTVDKTGTHEQCTNDYGAFDMVGNLHEWIDDPAGTFRGGFFMDTTINGDGCEYATTAHSTAYHDYSIGFRCCKDAQDN